MRKIKRAVVIVLDGAGAGWQHDAAKYGDEGANTLKHVICYGYYFENVEGYSVPDPIPELKGSFSLKAGKSKMFLIKVYTDHDTDPGMYSATLSVLDPEGKEIKRAPVYAYVWNFDLPDASNMIRCEDKMGVVAKYAAKREAKILFGKKK